MKRLSEFMCIEEAEKALLAGVVIDDLPVVLDCGVLYFGLAFTDWAPGGALLHEDIVWRVEGAPRRGELLLARAADPASALSLVIARRLADRPRATC